MLRPTPRALALLGVGVPAGLMPALVSPGLWVAWLGFNAVLLLAAALDVLLAVPARAARARVTAPALVPLGHPAELEIRVQLRGGRAGMPVETRCDLEGPTGASPPDDALQLHLDARGRALGRIRLQPERRGMVRCKAVWLRWAGPLGLLARVQRVDLERAETPVVPDIVAVREAALRLSRNRNFLAGLKRQRYIGDGSEFESLKEFQPGYDHRAIDWKSSARQRKLLVRQMEAERNHRIVLAFDTGYLMSQPLDGKPRLDHAIDAALLLALLSLRGGDRVGVFGFDQEVRLWLEPQPGMPTLQRIMQQSALLDYHSHETNFTRGLAELGARLRRRALIVVLTDFADTVTAEQMVENLGHLARRHVIVFVALRDRRLAAVGRQEPTSFDALNRAVVADDLGRDREIVLTSLRRHGIFCIDALPEEVTVQLLNRYLEIKRRGVL